MSSPNDTRHRGPRRIAPATGQSGTLSVAQGRTSQRSTSRAGRTHSHNGARLAQTGGQAALPGISGTNRIHTLQPTAIRQASEHQPRAQPPFMNQRVTAESIRSQAASGSAPAAVGARPPTRLPPNDSNPPQDDGATTQNEIHTDGGFTFENLIYDPSIQAHGIQTGSQDHTFGDDTNPNQGYHQDLGTADLGQTDTYGSDPQAFSPSNALGSPEQVVTDTEWGVSQDEATPMALDSDYKAPSSYLAPPMAAASGAAIYQQVFNSQQQTQRSFREDLQNMRHRMDNSGGRMDNFEGRMDNFEGRLHNFEGKLVAMERQMNG